MKPYHVVCMLWQALLCFAHIDGQRFVNAVYFVNWGIYARNYHPKNLPVNAISHILYAFLNVRADGTVFSADTYADLEKIYDGAVHLGNDAHGCIEQLYQLKKSHRHVKVLLSIGGWTWSTNVAAAAATAATRERFAKTAVEFMADWAFDGIDIDWEYPADDFEAENLAELMRALRAELDTYSQSRADGYHFELSMAAPAGKEHYGKLHMAELDKHVDFFNLLAYDYAGSFSTLTGHQANLYHRDFECTPFNTDDAVNAYIAGGIPASKIVLGMPVYGRSFVGSNGLGTPFTGVGQGTWEVGVWDYKALPKAGSEMRFDEAAGAGYTYDKSTKEFVSFDSPSTVLAKVEYLKQKGLGGSMFWEASADKTGDESLIETSRKAQGRPSDRRNNLLYPDSRFDNIRSGSPEI